MTFGTNNTECARIDSSGNLGVGTTSPSGRITVSTNGSGGVNVNESTNATATYGYLTVSHYINGAFISTVAGSNASADVLRLGTGNTERARIDSSGNLGIGTSSPNSTGFGKAVEVYSAAASAASIVTGGSNSYSWVVSSDTNAFRAFKGATELMRLDSSGNLGLGVTPSASGLSKAFDFVNGAEIFGYNNGAYLTANAYHNGTNWIYKATAAATFYTQNSGQHIWYNAASGTAGNTISFTQPMTLDASGNLLVGTTSQYGSAKVSVSGSITATSGWSGTNSSAGKLGGVVQSFVCERNGVGTATNVMAFGNGSTLGKGIRMPFAGKLLAATLAGTGINGTVTIDVYQNGSANSSYRLTATNGSAADIGVTQDWSGSPLSFSAGDTIGWYQTAVPTAANAYNVTFYVIFD